jgi:hypothetical protein
MLRVSPPLAFALAAALLAAATMAQTPPDMPVAPAPAAAPVDPPAPGAPGEPAPDAPATPPTLATFATLPTGGATESLCQSPDGTIYVTLLDEHRILKVATDGAVSQFADPPGVMHVLGIACPIDDEIAAVVYTKTFRRAAPAAPGGLDFSDTGSRVVIFDGAGRTTAEIAPAANVALNGIAAAERGIYFAADSNSGAVYRIDVDEKRAEAWFKHDGFGPTRSSAIGLDGIKVRDDWVYFSSASAMGIYRIWLAPDGKPRGALATLAEGLAFSDFDVAPNGDVYAPAGTALHKVAAPGGGPLRYIDPIPPAAAAMVSRDGKWLYLLTSEPGGANRRIMRAALP